MASSDVWKAFDKNEITHSVAHHLVAIGDLKARQGYARVSDVARYLDITRGSASLTLKALKERDYVLEDGNKFLGLSDKGQRIADRVQAKRAIVSKFLTDVLHVDERQAQIDACKVEHLFSLETSEKLLHFVQFLLSNAPESCRFLEAFSREEGLCQDLDKCPVCEDECLMPSEPEV